MNTLMDAGAAHHNHLAPSALATSAIKELFAYECDRDMRGIAVPCPEVQITVRFGPSTRSGLDAHAFGAREHVHRKLLHCGQRTVTARLRLGTPLAVLGVPASEITGRIVALEDLWGQGATQRLFERLVAARSVADEAAILESAIAERLASTKAHHFSPQLALEAAARLTKANVKAVATELGVSERHLRRQFREATGVGPKTFSKLARFRRALRAAHENGNANWASVAADAGYYDQAHLIAEFRSVAGVTPQTLIAEISASASFARL